MSEFSIREYREEDIPALSLLWQNTFDDSEALIADFFRLLPGMGTGLTAVKDGIPRGAAYVISGMELVNPYGHTVPCGYIYAVAVDESCRGLGMGSALTRAAAEKGLELGAAFICTLPAGDSLYDWYNELIGVSCALCRKTELIKCFPFAEVAPISAAEYGVLREKLLCGREHLCLAPPALEFQQLLCKAYGGGFYMVNSGVCAAYMDGDRAVIRELLLPGGMDASAAASVGSALGAEELVLYAPASQGEKYISAPAGIISPDCVWDLSFD